MKRSTFHRRGLQFDNSEICVTKSIGLAYGWRACKKKIKCFHAVFALFFFNLRAISKCKSPQELIFRKERFNGLFFCVSSVGNLCLERFIFGIYRYLTNSTLLSF